MTTTMTEPAVDVAEEAESTDLTFLAESADEPSPLTGLAEELRRQLETKRDLKADSRRVSLDPDTASSLVIDMPGGAEDFTLTDHAHGQVCTHLEIGSKLYKRLRANHPDLLAGLVNPLLCREPSIRLVRTMDGKARAFLSDTYRPRDNWDLLDQAILPAIGALPPHVARGLYFKECSLSETHLYVKIVLPDFELPVTPAVGDVIRGGLIVKNSEVGSSSLTIAPYTDRLWCLNGAVHTEYGKAQRHVGRRTGGGDGEAWEFYSDETLRLDDAAFFSKCRDTVTATLNETVFQAIVQQMRDLADVPLEAQPVDAVKEITRRHDLTEKEGDSILTALLSGQGGLGLTGWGMVNAITQTARDHRSADRRVELETLAGKMIGDPTLVQV